MRIYSFLVRTQIATPEGFALLATIENQLERVARLSSTSYRFHAPFCFELAARERAEHDRAVTTSRAAPGEDAFTNTYEEGKKLSIDEAVAYVLEES